MGGYFLLHTLSGIANAMGWSFVIHTAILTATGYSLTLLMAAAFRRLIKVKPVITWAVSIGWSCLRRLPSRRSSSGATRRSSNRARGRLAFASWGNPAHQHSADRVVGALLRDQLLPAAGGAHDRMVQLASQAVLPSSRCCATSSTRTSCSTR
jgi:hypothetical protein